MPRGDGTGPAGKGPKTTSKGMPTPKKDGSGCGKCCKDGNCPPTKK